MQKENMTTQQYLLANVTSISIRKAGTVSKELQENKWPLNLQGLTNVVRLTLPG